MRACTNFFTEETVTDVLTVACKNKNSPAVVAGSQNKGCKYHPKMQNKIGVHRVKGKKNSLITHSTALGTGEKEIPISSCVPNTFNLLINYEGVSPSFPLLALLLLPPLL